MGSFSFYYCESLESVSLPIITSIEYYTFTECTSLTSVYLPEVKTIGYYDEYAGGAMEEGAFYGCTSLETISLPNATILSTGTFANCTSLKNVDLPEVTKIYNSVFAWCTSLTTISLPSAESLGWWSFYDCTKLESVSIQSVINFSDGNPFVNCSSLTILEVNSDYFILEDDVLYDTNKEEIVFALTSISGDYVAPSSVVTINDEAFSDCDGLVSVTFPMATTIGSSAFSDCDGLKTASFPKVTTVEYYAFYNCDILELVYLPAATNISTIVFSYCESLPSLEIATNEGTVIETFGGSSSMFSSVTLSNLTLTLGAANTSMVEGLYFNAPYGSSSYTYGPFKEIIFTGGVIGYVTTSGENAGGSTLNW